tara:strand:+ start:3381 stop:5087 length:1707 start_codon:yes stop_codon:yes gene_type:complete
MKSLINILKFLKIGQKFNLILITTAIFLSGVLEVFGISLIIPILSQLIYPDNEISNLILSYFDFIKPEQFFLIFFLLIILIFLAKNLFLIFANWQIGKFSADISYFTTNIIIQNYLSLNYLTYKKESTSNLIKNIQSEASILGRSVINILSIYSEIIILIFLIFLITFFKPILFYSIICAIFFGYIIFIFSKKILFIQGKKRQISESASIQLLNDLSRSYQEIKISNKKKFFLNKILNEYNLIVKSVFYSSFIQSLPRILFEMILLFGILIFAIILYYLYGSYNETFLIISFFTVVSLRVIPSINRIVFNLQQITFFKPVIENISNEFDKIKKPKDTFIQDFNFDNLSLNKISFDYDKNKKDLIFKNLDLEINKGESICIIGPSGSGKSTLLNLIMGFLEPISGQIKINNHLDNYENPSWFKKIGYVSQANFIIDGTLKSNVALGYEEKEINNDKVLNCLKLSGLKEFLKSIDFNLNFKLGEEGKLISAGQKQRICIARALYDSPSVLILDEATSSLDKSTEIEILDNLLSKKDGITKIIVTHRDIAKSYCDKILDLGVGKLKLKNNK